MTEQQTNLPTFRLKDLPEKISKVILTGDLTPLSPEEKGMYYAHVCESVGFNPLTKPFDFLVMSQWDKEKKMMVKKEILYANKGAAEQARALYSISVTDVKHEKLDDIYIVTVTVKDGAGRTDQATGAVALKAKDKDGKEFHLSGEALANAFMKAETKAKRRASLSICGLNMLDETEVETIKDAQKVDRPLNLEALS